MEYVLETLAKHRVVILGENHWIRHDVLLVGALVPRLAAVGVHTLGVEFLPASQQARLDRLLARARWEAREAMALLREGEWPYQEYLDLLRSAWVANHARPNGTPALRILALSPGMDWRATLLPKGQHYDGFMAERVLEALAKGDRVLVYCGLNHGWTAYIQPERPREARIEAYMDRMGNILRRRLGEDVFLVMLQGIWQRRVGGAWTYGLPLEGRIDCIGAGGPPKGFDIAGSSWAEIRIPPDYYYAMGYPALRFMDLAEGYIWTSPIEDFQSVRLIPLDEFAPDSASLAEVAANNPFSDAKGLKRDEIERLWDENGESLANFLRKNKIEHLRSWRKGCP